MSKVLMKGNEAIAEAAIRAGCAAYFGYPITPQTEVLEYMSRRMPILGRAFVQAESELGAVNMLYGAACTGVRAMTSTSGPRFSLMQETLSYISASMVPAVIVNVMRGGPGLGNIQPSQADYLQMTKGGGHGDYRIICLAPATVQEVVDHVILAFDLADKYLQPVMVIADGMIGQIMEPVELPEMGEPARPPRPWALTGAKGRPKNVVTSLYLSPEKLEQVNLYLQTIFRRIEADEQRYEAYLLDDAEIAVVAYGTSSRIARTAIKRARQKGIKVGLFRPISVYPFPYEPLQKMVGKARTALVVEMSAGQMIEDVRLALCGALPIHFYGRMGGMVPMPDDVLAQIEALT
jgi:2-oxoglutarate/2-oxoacid ferredoxin oxidoreductase subunit alpha